MFLLPGLVVACHIIGGDVLGPARRSAMVTYLRNHQQADGGYGLHIEGPSTMFGTTMNYVALRLLGLDATDPTCVAARQFIHKHGGATMNPHWGKFWLATLGVMEWDGACTRFGTDRCSAPPLPPLQCNAQLSTQCPLSCGFFRDGFRSTRARCGATAAWCTCP